MKLEIERLGHHGLGVAPGPVFVPMALPGEVVEGEVVDGRMAAARIVTPSPDRVTAPCPHYRSCGGCLLMHASDPFVADWKAGAVAGAVRAQGLDATVRGVETSPPRSRRRANFAGRRTKKGAIVGFHGRASGVLVPIPDCLLLDPALMSVMPALQEIVLLGASRKAEMTLAATVAEGGVDLSVSGGKPLDQGLFSALSDVAERHGLARISWDGELALSLHPALQRFDDLAIEPPSGGFLQATAAGERALRALVTEAVGEPRRLLDLFAGSGTFALPLARRAEVHAVEGDPAMLAALDRGWRRAPGLHRLTTEARDLFRRPLLADELRGYDAVVIDPPRAGAQAQTAALAAAGVPVIASVSCNPVSFARDAQVLVAAGYRLDWIHVVDQFRWSPHIELVARFIAPGGPAGPVLPVRRGSV